MMSCKQACPYHTLRGCIANEHGVECIMTNTVSHKPMTNADHIRSMTDEELVEALWNIVGAEACLNLTAVACKECRFYELCDITSKEGIRNWLNRPYKGDGDVEE